MKVECEDAEFLAHLERLRLPDARAYASWCDARSLRPLVRKSAGERGREVRLAEEERLRGALDAARKLSRHPEDVLRSALTGSLSESLARRAELRIVAACARQRPLPPREPLLALLLLAQRRRFLLAERVVGRYDDGPGNTLVGGLFALARLSRGWVRPLDDWRPDSCGTRRQFASLARHLLASWSVPTFLDGAFFAPDPDASAAKRSLGWWRHAGRGLSLRTAPELPLALTRRMAHLIHTEAPAELTPEEGLRWGQACGLEIGGRQARALIATRLGESFDDEAFWEGFVRFLAENPLLDPSQVGPLFDYLDWERRTPPAPGERDRLPVGFTLRGRTAGALLAKMEAWHARTIRESQLRTSVWEPSGRGGLSLTEGRWSWTIRELTTARELSAEGRAMRHCVGSYAPSCARGSISIWSVQTLGPPTDGWLRVMTVAVSRQGQITEARGWCNALPASRIGGYVRLAADEQGILLRGRRLVQRWAAQERLVLPACLADSSVSE